jgi:thiopeptide-type bacteriocin biosynthesis protein
MDEADWVSVHVFYQGDLDLPLIGAVRPLVEETRAAALARGFFFLRHWDGGPHLRVRLLAAGEEARDPLRRRLVERCERYLRDHPSATRLNPAAYAAQARRLAPWEGMSDYAREPYPNNSIRCTPYRREHDRYGRGASMEAVEGHFVDSSRIALALLAADATPDRRHSAAFTMTLLACRVDGGFAGASSPLSGPAAGTGAAVADFAGRYRRQRRRLLSLAGTALERATDPSGVPGVLGAWLRSIGRLRAELAAAPPPAGVAAVIDACVHLLCNRIGLSLDEERYVRYLVARTIADLDAAGGAR